MVPCMPGVRILIAKRPTKCFTYCSHVRGKPFSAARLPHYVPHRSHRSMDQSLAKNLCCNCAIAEIVVFHCGVSCHWSLGLHPLLKEQKFTFIHSELAEELIWLMWPINV